ncbi:hypothetical protein GCM10020331_084810 [Ectobacillus funiculus]
MKKDESKHRWTVDTEEDFQLVERIISTIYPENNFFQYERCITFNGSKIQHGLILTIILNKKIRINNINNG